MALEKINSRLDGNQELRVFQDSKQGGTGTWTPRGGADSWLATVAASQTGADGVYHLSGLKIGDRLDGYYLVGQVESAGNTATVDAKLVSMTAAAADVTVADVAGSSMTQLSVTADTAMTSANTTKNIADFQRVFVEEGKTYALVVTVTTAAATDVAMQGVVLKVTPDR